MTSIEQIQISGVRSFNPDPNHRQSIIFQKPLTVILGKNGAGKTTIIEALLNACTGQMPPGSGAEKSSFVYDPKVMGETDVKAQIRLLFTGRGGKVMQVIRSFQATRTRNKTTFTTLDNTVAFQDATTGKVVSSTYRANDVDRAVPEMLGVSPAVLEHVIFCHQEDCNWPLSPPKDVKKIFDEIFAATRYVLALDRLRENSKELRRQQKEHESNLMALREHRDQAEQLERDISAKEESVKVIQLRVKNLEPQLKELQSVASSLSTVEQSAESLVREAAIIQGRIEEKKQSINRVNFSPPTHSLEEILELKEGFSEHVKKLEAEAVQKTSLLEVAEVNRQKYEETALSLRSSISFFEQQEQEYKRNSMEIIKIVKDVSKDYIINENNMDEVSLQKINYHLNQELQKALEERNKVIKAICDKIKVLEEERSITFRSMDSDSKEKEMKEEQIKHLQERTLSVKETLEKLKPYATSSQLKILKDTVKSLEQRVEAMEVLKKKGENYRQRQNILQKVETQNTIVAELRQELAKHKQLTSGEAEMNLLRNQIEEKKKFLNIGIKEKLVPGLLNFGHEVSESHSLAHISIIIEQIKDQKSEALRAIQVERSELDRQVAVLQQQRTQRMEEIMREDAELQQKRVIVLNVLGNIQKLDNFETILSKARETLHKASHKRHALEAMASCYANFIEIAKSEEKCPVCNRNFSEGKELKNFVELNSVQQEASPGNIEKAQEEVDEAENFVRHLESIETDVHELRRLMFHNPKLEQQLISITEELANRSALLEDVDRKRDGVESQLKRIQELMRAGIDLNAISSEIYSLKQQLSRRETAIEELQAAILNNNNNNNTNIIGDNENDNIINLTYDQISEKYEKANAELYSLNLQLNEAQRREDGESDQELSNELNSKRAEYYQLEGKLIRQGELQETLARYKDESNQYKERIAVINTRRVELQIQLDNIDNRLNILQKEKQEVLHGELQFRVDKIEKSIRALENIMPNLLNYIKSQQSEKLTETREKLHSIEILIQTSITEVQKLRTTIQEARRVVDEQHRRAVEIDRQIEFLEKQNSIAEDEDRLKQIESALTELKGREIKGVADILGTDIVARESVPRIREMIRNKISEIEKARAQQEGNVEAMLQDIDGLKSQLLRDKYRDIEKRYRSTFLKVQTTEIAVSDLEKYYRALEKAVQSYHQEKIAQINQILADLWRQTYKGSDIDTVELRSEDDASSTTTRRSYSYRVVMKRGNSEMDMRGRCSAGQKVLASVLIRLALSEAFSCDCGILALDEPTTNLDEDNARSLAESLRLLIDNHRTIKHFQLIVITHDEQFVRALGGQALDTFYYIHKDREGAFSVIEERTFDQLFAA